MNGVYNIHHSRSTEGVVSGFWLLGVRFSFLVSRCFVSRLAVAIHLLFTAFIGLCPRLELFLVSCFSFFVSRLAVEIP
jgi:hypothetical protein